VWSVWIALWIFGLLYWRRKKSHIQPYFLDKINSWGLLHGTSFYILSKSSGNFMVNCFIWEHVSFHWGIVLLRSWCCFSYGELLFSNVKQGKHLSENLTGSVPRQKVKLWRQVGAIYRYVIRKTVSLVIERGFRSVYYDRETFPVILVRCGNVQVEFRSILSMTPDHLKYYLDLVTSLCSILFRLCFEIYIITKTVLQKTYSELFW